MKFHFFKILLLHLCNNFNLEIGPRQGDSPLIMATKKGLDDIVRVLLNHGADTKRKDPVRVE